MRYGDAPHLDVGSFYARNPGWGKVYRQLGYLGLVLGVVWSGNPSRVAILLGALVLTWLVAWYQVVGTLWRSSLVAACLYCALVLSLRAVGAS
jgi:hypothetical protein